MTLPLLNHGPGDVVIRVGGKAINRDTLLGQVMALVTQLPEADQVILICDDRYRFLLLFCAAMVRGQTVLLPPNGTRGAVAGIAEDYPGVYVATDTPHDDLQLPLFEIAIPNASACSTVPQVPAEQVVAIPFTSGSTGQPRAHPKRWGDLVAGAVRTLERLAPDSATTIVATVPPQHMFGLETSVVLPLVGGLATTAERPFFPSDLMAALQQQPAPRLLVTTPLHLRALAAEETDWPALEFILSATAPLSRELAVRASERFAAPVLEIFGSTETGAIATRRTIEQETWFTLEGIRLQARAEYVEIDAGQTDPVVLSDDLVLYDATRFAFRGRHHDMIKIAGKRASLADLNQRLLALPGIEDGAFMQLEENGAGVARLAAVVVAPNLDENTIIAALGDQLDPVFLPRRLRRVSRLPRDASGKLPCARLRDLLNGTEEAP